MEEQKRNQMNLMARECMVSALTQLLETKPLSEISVTEITNKAGVSRMTYYRNYHSKEEIISSYLEDIFKAFREDTASAVEKGGFFQDYENILYCVHFFEKHQHFVRSLYRSGMGDLMMQSMTSYILGTYYTEDKGLVYYYKLQALAGSLYTIYIAWILRDTRDSAENMSQIIYDIYQQVL